MSLFERTRFISDIISFTRFTGMFLEGMNFQVGNVKGELQVYIGTQKNDQLFWYGYSE